MSLIPIVSAAQLLPAALVAGKVATQAVGTFAEMLRDAVDLEPKSASPVSAASQAAPLSSEVSSLLRDFVSSFQELLKEHRLDGSAGVQLRLNGTGDVEVAGSHPEASAIEGLLAKTPRLSELFRRLAAQVTADRKEQEFAAFQKNPQSTGNDFPLLFGKANAPRFQLFLQGGSAAVSFL